MSVEGTAATSARSGAALRKKLFSVLALVVVLAVSLWLTYYWIAQRGHVATDNAYVSIDVAQVTPLVSAAVRDVHVVNSQMVRRGDVLVRLDDSDQRLAVTMAEAALAQAVQRYRQARGNAGAARGRLAARASDTEQAKARLAEAEADMENARVELDRREALAVNGFVSGQQLANARTTFRTARATRDAAAAAVGSARGAADSAAGDLQSSAALVEGVPLALAPEVTAARARLALARLELERTIVRASVDGIVTNRQVQVGQRVAAGVPMMALVPVAAAYVEANFKESQLAGVRLGHPALLTSDFYGDSVIFHGRVAGFAGGTGATLSLIPPQNATGNWIKVVQRLPVRIELDPAELAAHPLRAGLSMEVAIDMRR